ncbi:MAG: response regulator [Candidatus Omnitrophota bacterium]
MPGKTVLIVDDEKDVATVLKARLASLGYNAICAYDGEEGLKLAKEKKPDAIFLDIMMPKVDGISVVLKLKADHDTRAIPVVMLSGIKQAEEKAVTKSLGVAHYITKPYDKDEIIAVLKQMFG